MDLHTRGGYLYSNLVFKSSACPNTGFCFDFLDLQWFFVCTLFSLSSSKYLHTCNQVFSVLVDLFYRGRKRQEILPHYLHWQYRDMKTNPFEAQPNLDSDLQSIDVDPAVIASKFTGLVSYESVMILPVTI